jgi:hypothetical protein
MLQKKEDKANRIAILFYQIGILNTMAKEITTRE